MPVFKINGKNLENSKTIEINLIHKKREIVPATIQNEKPKIVKKELKKNQKKPLSKKTKKPIKAKKKVEKPSNKPPIKPTSNEITNHKETQSKKAENFNFCKENVGFKVLNSKQSYDYPKKAKMLKIKGKFEVEVSFKILDNNRIEILNIEGDNKIFNDEARKLTKKLNIEVLNSKVSNCVITKPFIFISN